MKKILLLLTMVTTLVTAALAQDGASWTLLLNKQVLAKSTTAGKEQVAYINKGMFQTKKMVTLTYRSADTQEDWHRKFYVNDESEKTVKTFALKGQNGTISFTLKDLKQYADANKPLYIYTMALPNDPALAASVRVRRFIVCKIMWK